MAPHAETAAAAAESGSRQHRQSLAQAHFAAAPREFHAARAAAPRRPPPKPPRAISEILEPHAAPPRAAIEPELPPDHPLEPGTRPTARVSSPSERIAASESAISEISARPKEPVSTSSFIAAARRAAQAAAAAARQREGGQGRAQGDARPRPRSSQATSRKADGKEPSTITSKIRSLLVGASVVVIVLGTFKMAMTLLDTGSAPPMPAMENSSEPAPRRSRPPTTAPSRADAGARGALDDLADPDRPAIQQHVPRRIARQRAGRDPASRRRPPSGPAGLPRTISPARFRPRRPRPPAGKLAMVQVPPSERLPDGIGGPALRAAALKGDPAAAYEIGVRFAEGKGVAPNLDEAAKWYDRAAQAGVVPAIFRLGTFYEKGMSVKKDVDIARRYYVQAAERGNAKAMHNLAVLDADGGGKGADYKSASQWFRKAADRGVADSQFNLGILYARGIGVEQNLAESFKWFSLAAAQGDADAGHKRDDIAKRLDAQSLAAAKLAIQTFTPEPQPDDADQRGSPGGRLGQSAGAGQRDKAHGKPAAGKRAAAPAATTSR